MNSCRIHGFRVQKAGFSVSDSQKFTFSQGPEAGGSDFRRWYGKPDPPERKGRVGVCFRSRYGSGQMAKRSRLDLLLAERGTFTSRTAASRAIRAGQVKLGKDGPIALRPSQEVPLDQEIEVLEGSPVEGAELAEVAGKHDRLVFLAVRRGDVVHSRSDVAGPLRVGDVIMALGPPDELSALARIAMP